MLNICCADFFRLQSLFVGADLDAIIQAVFALNESDGSPVGYISYDEWTAVWNNLELSELRDQVSHSLWNLSKLSIHARRFTNFFRPMIGLTARC